MKKTFILIPLITLLAACQESGMSKYDILGVRTGMTKEQAEAKLEAVFRENKRENDGYYFREGDRKNYNNPDLPNFSLAWVTYCYKFSRYGCAGRMNLAFLPESKKIYSIYRTETIGEKDKPETHAAIEKLRESFKEKYGTEIKDIDAASTDKDGKPVNTETCNIGQRLFLATGLDKLKNEDVEPFMKTGDHCKIEVYYRIRTEGSSKGFANSFGISLTDYASVNAEIDKIKQQKQKEVNKAPKL